MQINISQQQFRERLDLIPDDLRKAIFSAETQEVLNKIITKYSLSEKQADRLRENTSWVFMGFIHPDILKDIFVKDLGVSMIVATAIAGDLNHELFIPHKKSITEVLLTYPPKKEWLEMPTATTPAPTIKPIAPTTTTPVILSPQAKNLPPPAPAVDERSFGTSLRMTEEKKTPPVEARLAMGGKPEDDKKTFRPIAPPPLQVARPLGSRPSILEVQRGTDDIRRAPQAPVGEYETQSVPPINTKKSDFQQTNERQYLGGQTSTTPPVIPAQAGIQSNVQLGEVGLPTTVDQTPHVMFKYVHPEPPTMTQVPNSSIQPSTPTPLTPKPVAPTTPPVIPDAPMSGSSTSDQPQNAPSTSSGNIIPPFIPATSSELSRTKAGIQGNVQLKEVELPKEVQPLPRDTFHKTPVEHENALPTEHRVMDLEEYHTDPSVRRQFGEVGLPASPAKPSPSGATTNTAGDIVQSGNMLNLKD
ncbi:MAG: hypothetical protein HZA35_00485 [Parcubacteria group bacterium]|nr:hypothetical protein [Parcubacteria group bacterium]